MLFVLYQERLKVLTTRRIPTFDYRQTEKIPAEKTPRIYILSFEFRASNFGFRKCTAFHPYVFLFLTPVFHIPLSCIACLKYKILFSVNQHIRKDWTKMYKTLSIPYPAHQASIPRKISNYKPFPSPTWHLHRIIPCRFLQPLYPLSPWTGAAEHIAHISSPRLRAPDTHDIHF